MAGLGEQILEALNQSRIVPDALQMIDSTVVRAHHQAAGACLNLCVSDRAQAVFRYVQASKRPVNIMAS